MLYTVYFLHIFCSFPSFNQFLNAALLLVGYFHFTDSKTKVLIAVSTVMLYTIWPKGCGHLTFTYIWMPFPNTCNIFGSTHLSKMSLFVLELLFPFTVTNRVRVKIWIAKFGCTEALISTQLNTSGMKWNADCTPEQLSVDVHTSLVHDLNNALET